MRVLCAALISMFALSSQAQAAELPASTHFIGRYEFDWNGIKLGVLVLDIDETPNHYIVHLKVNSAGIVNLFTRHMSDTLADGVRSGSNYHPLHYESHYQTKDKPRHLKLTYDTKNILTEELVEPPENHTIRPLVPHALKDGSYDPLTLLMVVRAGATKVRAFDAKQLYEVYSKSVDKGILRLKTGNQAAAVYVLSRVPLAGMTDKEMREYNKGEPPLTLFLSDDARHIPLGVSVPLYLGSVHGFLVKECKSWDECEQ